MGDRFVGMLDAEMNRQRDALVMTAVREFVPLDAEEGEMVRAEIDHLAEWLGLTVQDRQCELAPDVALGRRVHPVSASATPQVRIPARESPRSDIGRSILPRSNSSPSQSARSASSGR